MPETVICAPVRTAVGRYGGVFEDMQAASLGAAVISAVVERTGVDPELIDDVILGQCYPNGEAPALGRVAALGAAACLVTTRAIAGQLGLVPMARLVSWAVAGVPPRTMGIGPVPAVAMALGRAGVDLRDVDLIGGGQGLAALFERVA
jgi:acetyl-CoA acetyltransferase